MLFPSSLNEKLQKIVVNNTGMDSIKENFGLHQNYRVINAGITWVRLM
jgi:hypothetical protein